jgi:hypothetical protein
MLPATLTRLHRARTPRRYQSRNLRHPSVHLRRRSAAPGTAPGRGYLRGPTDRNLPGQHLTGNLRPRRSRRSLAVVAREALLRLMGSLAQRDEVAMLIWLHGPRPFLLLLLSSPARRYTSIIPIIPSYSLLLSHHASVGNRLRLLSPES